MEVKEQGNLCGSWVGWTTWTVPQPWHPQSIMESHSVQDNWWVELSGHELKPWICGPKTKDVLF